jgi:hypothetical protein
MRRWLVVGVLLFATAWFIEHVLGSPTLSAFFYVPSVLSVPFSAVAALCWTWLAHGRSL